MADAGGVSPTGVALGMVGNAAAGWGVAGTDVCIARGGDVVGGASDAGWAAAGRGGAVTVIAGWPFGALAILRVTAVLTGSGVSSFSTKLSAPAASWVRPPGSCAVTLASMVWPMRRISASMLARASFTAASAGSAAGSERPVSCSSAVARSDMPPPCRESG